MASDQATTATDYVTVKEAAGILRVSVSSIWRWINDGTLIAYRLGHRRVLLRRVELARAIQDARHGAPGSSTEPSQPMPDDEAQAILALVAEAQRELDAMLAERGGRYFRPSADVLGELREERSNELSAPK